MVDFSRFIADDTKLFMEINPVMDCLVNDDLVVWL